MKGSAAILSFLNIVLCVLAFGVPSPDGELADGFEGFEAGSGLTVDQLLPFCASVPAGVYAVRLDAGGKTVSRLITVCE